MKCVRSNTPTCTTCTFPHFQFIHTISCYKESEGYSLSATIACGRCKTLIHYSNSWHKIESLTIQMEEFEFSQKFETGQLSKVLE